MDVLKAQLDRLQRQLAGLTPSQKMLTGALVAIMLMTLMYWGKYAGEAEMAEVTSASIPADDLERITNELAAKGIKTEISGDKVMVPADRRVEAIADLSYARVLPKQDKAGFETMLDKMNPFLPQTTTDLMFNRGKEITVGQIVSNFPGVADAEVMIDPTDKERIGETIQPSATVTITMRDGAEPSQQLVNAAADVVEGSQADLKRDHIKVVIDGRPWRVQDTDNNFFDGSEQLQLQQKAEVRLANKVKDEFQFINGLMVSVTVKLNNSSLQQDQTVYDPKGKSVLIRDSDDTSNSTSGNPPSGEPGALPNVQPGGANAALSINSGSGGGSNETSEKHEQDLQPYVGTTHSTTVTPAGDATPIAATVRVPMSYFAAVWQRQNPAAPGTTPVIPTEAQLATLVATTMPTIKDGVIKCVGLTDDKEVSVEPYTDPSPMILAGASTSATMSMPLSALVGHTKEIVLSGLALFSLLMVSMMVRKSAPAPVAAPLPPPGPPKIFDPAEEIAGIATDPSTPMDAKETREDAIRAQQVIEQVSTLVKENPDSAAALVKRWLSRPS
ncbi:MAG TPA: flagellar M-ring protein FliF C-terminal domain-containing protein [Tepidisphaeraceae bacterium]|jgi:flagellar biosynthesis/type III secretory pathway M-ring protein FliF/YscJ|nr:flagellar M-ring protein FliF C-terminal domain-containing protein [Tepidisphaeraceae bacterium]